jgi:4-diphosphocytidyl-2C-methyl-D-erythritol kinase
MPVKSVTVRVPAKVNLQLSVGPKEPDGYHNLVSVFQAISIFDDVTIKLSKHMVFRQIQIIWQPKQWHLFQKSMT